MIVATPDGRLYMVYWGEEDNFEKRRLKEVSFKYAKHLCKYQDYITFRQLTNNELEDIESGFIDVTWDE